MPNFSLITPEKHPNKPDMQDLLEYTQKLQRQLQMLATGNLSHRLGNIRQIVNALENENHNQFSQINTASSKKTPREFKRQSVK